MTTALGTSVAVTATLVTPEFLIAVFVALALAHSAFLLAFAALAAC